MSERRNVVMAWGLIASIGILAAGWSLPAASVNRPAQLPEPIVSATHAPRPAPISRGPGSCAASACHGSIADVPGLRIRGNEYTTWVTSDPHARAFETLHGARSQQIALRLSQGTGKLIPPYEDMRCLSCHATVIAHADVPQGVSREGVGCESCHGDAARWLGPHTTAAWDSLDAHSKEQDYGLIDTKSIGRRAEVCAGCHVGAPAKDGMPVRDVNHDLIAAGHPRLNFELAAYHDNLPKHWKPANSDAAPEFPARLWLVGQTTAEAAALALLEDRARDNDRPWPEFAESGCFSCHHTLRDEAWRRPRLQGERAVPPWGSWIFALADDFGPAESLADLRLEMGRAVPDRAGVAALCERLAGELVTKRQAAATEPMGAAQVRARIAQIDNPSAWSSVASWDEAAQRYLALVPLLQAWKVLEPHRSTEQDSLRHTLEEKLKSLRFAPEFASPAGFDPGSFSKRP